MGQAERATYFGEICRAAYITRQFEAMARIVHKASRRVEWRFLVLGDKVPATVIRGFVCVD